MKEILKYLHNRRNHLNGNALHAIDHGFAKNHEIINELDTERNIIESVIKDIESGRYIIINKTEVDK